MKKELNSAPPQPDEESSPHKKKLKMTLKILQPLLHLENLPIKVIEIGTSTCQKKFLSKIKLEQIKRKQTNKRREWNDFRLPQPKT